MYSTRYVSLFFSIMILFLLGSKALYASGDTRRVEINWQTPIGTNPAEDSYLLPSLFFRGAVYSDSLPQIPAMIIREPLSVPHFAFDFLVEELEVVACSPDEAKILEQSGFQETEFQTFTDTETASGKSFSRFHIYPVRKNEGVYEKLVSFRLTMVQEYNPSLKQGSVIHEYPEQSVLASGNWYKICVDEEGVFRLDHQDLVNLGIDPAQIDKSTLQLFGNGGGMLPEANDLPRFTDLQENAIWISGNNSGPFTPNDYLLFYGQSPHQWTYNDENDAYEYQVHYYSGETCYFLTHSQQQGKRIQQRNSLNETPTHTINEFYDYQVHEREQVNIIGSGKLWLGELFDITLSRDFAFSFPNLVPQKPLSITVSAVARSSITSNFVVEAFGQSQNIIIGSVNIANVTGVYARESQTTLSVVPQADDFSVQLSYNKSAPGGRGWLNHITVNAKRSLIHQGNQMFFRNPSVVGNGNIVKYQLDNAAGSIRVWDLSDPFNVVEQEFQITGSNGSFVTSGDQISEFVSFSQQEFPKPVLKGAVENQNLHGAVSHELVIVVPDQFRQEADRLADFRRENGGLSVLVVSPQEIYNEFSSGVADISAIRNFMKMFYDRAANTQGSYPSYLLLFGNGTYDNKNQLDFGGNLIPTFQTMQSLNPANSYITDDFFGLLDDHEGFDADGAIDLGIGRLPVRTQDEARFIVDKLLRYDQRIEGLQPGTDNPQFAGVIANYADWRNVIALVADDEDNNVHYSQAENLASYIDAQHPVFNVEKIYLDAYEQVTLAGGSRYPAVNKSINNRVNQGALLINYIGHGGPRGLGHERILTFEDILSWGNFYNLPVFMTATCEFSSFDQPDANDLSAGVRVILKPDGGAAALFTTTRLAYSGSNFNLNEAFMLHAFSPMENGEMPRLGDLIRIAKVESSSVSTLKNFVLLGDPSMHMAYPKYKAVTTEIQDTIKALERVVVKGQIHTPSGTLASSYNGVIYPTVFDKEAVFSTLGNDPGSYTSEFTMQNRILYRGTASIVNGEFEFEFIVPRDISYNSGFGKISYYFDDGELFDGAGYFNDFIISGTSDDYSPDVQGPQIELYLNNTNFLSGNSTGPSPILLAYLQDESGINATGQIGHDIIAILNDDTSNPYVLNAFYQADLDSYQSGRVIYPFFNLEKGNYTLALRAWDVHNNVSTQSIDFVVTSAPGIMLSELVNIPNPFSDKTTFSIEHNKPATELRIVIDIFSLNGQLVKSIDESVYASGFNVPPIEWDGRDEGGTLLKNGIYIFRANVSTNDGDEIQRTEKLMILR